MVQNSMRKLGVEFGRGSKHQVRKITPDNCSSYATPLTVSLHSLLMILSLDEFKHLDRKNNRIMLKHQLCSFDLSSMEPQLDNYPSVGTTTPSLSISKNQRMGYFIDISNHYTKH